jgi:hypothetical protein
LPEHDFAGDAGAPEAHLTGALAAYRDDAGRLPEVVAALQTARVLTPVVATAGGTGSGEGTGRLDKDTDIAVPLLEGDDGRRALLAFSSVATMAAWDPKARPVPVLGPRAASVAVAEGASVVVLDLAGPVSCVLEESEVQALAAGRGAVPAYADPRVAGRLADLLARDPGIAAAWLCPQEGADARLDLRIDGGVGAPGGPSAALASLAWLAELVAGDPLLRGAAVRGLQIAVRADGSTGGRLVYDRGGLPPAFS